MNVLLTGDRGYIGSVLAPMLISRGHDVVGIDSGLFEDCLLYPEPETYLRYNYLDIRDCLLDEIPNAAIIHLAALSNDPLGELSPQLTESVNRDAAVRLARMAKAQGISRFVYASSQSMYGVSDTDEELDEDAPKNPITAYARTKWEAECAIKEMATDKFTVACMRPSTVFGASPRLRCDIVFNNMVADAHTTGRIEVRSDGTPWRPVVHVHDVCNAFIAGLEAPARIVNGRSYNVGIPNGNFTVRQLAEAAQRAVPGSEIVYTGAEKDCRSYRVSFNRILTELKDYYSPTWTLDQGANELVESFRRVGTRGRICNRLQQILYLKDKGILDGDLRRRS